MMLKNFAFKIYPFTLDIEERWYLSFKYVDGSGRERPRKVAISFKLKTVEERMGEVERLKKVIAEGYSPKPKEKKVVAANTTCRKLHEQLETHKVELKRKSVSSYRVIINKFEDYCREKVIFDITDTAANDFLNHLREIGRCGTTINNYRRTLKSYFKRLKSSKSVNRNAFENTKKRKESPKAREYFRPSQRQALQEWCDSYDKPLGLAIKFIFFCFVRPGNELTGLRVSDVNLDDAILTICGEISKNGLTERVKIPRQLLSILTEMNLHKYPQDWYLLGKDGVPSPQKMQIDGWNNRHQYALKGVGIIGRKRQFSIYGHKDAGAILLHKNGVPMRLIQLQLRHKNLATTSIYFTSFGLNELDELGDAFAEKGF